MKILKSWLKDYVPIKLTNNELIFELNLSGTEVESISGIDEKIINAKIKKVEPHPNADKLQIATVFDGKENLQIVCGAKNIEAGQIVPLAQIGAKIDDFEIKKAKLRGVDSYGMLCSEKELGLGEDHSGILILDEKYKIGESLVNYTNIEDPVLSLDITPNRGDCLSHIGIAREVAAITNSKTKKEPVSIPKDGERTSDFISVEIKEKTPCPQYYARIIRDVEIKESPDWLKERLIACGATPINNIVDVTNYIMLDLGHPLHAFDAKKIKDKKIIVRNAKKNEDIVTLDGEKRFLETDTLVIADAKEPVAIAGVMGGKDSEITKNTTDVVIEAAVFDRKSIRNTVKKLKLMTEASYRFERGVDPKGTEYAINKAAKLMAEVSGGKITSGIVKEGLEPQENWIDIPHNKINRLLGLNLSEEEINHILRLLGFEIQNDRALIPSWRHDIEVWQDLAEEVGRVYGYDKIKDLPLEKAKTPKKNDFYKKEFVKDILVNLGFSEVYDYTFLSEEDLKVLNISPSDLLEVENPIQPENKYLRKSLLPNILKDVAKNPSFDLIKIFEIGHVFSKTKEETNLALAVSGKKAQKQIEAAKEELSKSLKIDEKEFKIVELPREDLQKFKIKKPAVFVVEVSLDKLLGKTKLKDEDLKLKLNKKTVHYRPISKYPAITRDLAFLVDKKIKSEEVVDSIYEVSDLINRVELFDEFASDKLGKNKKNIAYHIDLSDMNKTLTDKEADEVIKNVVKKAKSTFEAKLRDY